MNKELWLVFEIACGAGQYVRHLHPLRSMIQGLQAFSTGRETLGLISITPGYAMNIYACFLTWEQAQDAMGSTSVKLPSERQRVADYSDVTIIVKSSDTDSTDTTGSVD